MEIDIIAQQLLNGLILGAIYGLIATGYTMVYGIIGMINFAHGDLYMIAAYLTAIGIAVLSSLGIQTPVLSLLFTLAFTLCITGLYGWIIERVAYRPLRQAPRLAALISAIGMSLVLQNYVQISQGSSNQGVKSLIEGTLRIGNSEQFVQLTNIQILILITALLSMCLLTIIVKKTRIGLAMRATQQDITMANLLGINTHRVIAIVFVIGACMASIAGMLVSLNYGSFDFYIGFITGIKAFTAAVLGGIGSLPGAMLGGIILGLAESLFAGFVNSDYKDVFAFSLLIVVLIFRPSGLLGRVRVEKI